MEERLLFPPSPVLVERVGFAPTVGVIPGYYLRLPINPLVFSAKQLSGEYVRDAPPLRSPTGSRAFDLFPILSSQFPSLLPIHYCPIYTF